MSCYFSEIDKNGVVLRVVVAEPEFIKSGALGDPKNWVQTSYDGSQRKNYAGVGYVYDRERDAFIAPKPGVEASLDEVTCRWVMPDEKTVEGVGK